MTLCIQCQHPLNCHHQGRCNVAGPGFVCDCGQPVIVDGEEVLGWVEPRFSVWVEDAS